MELDLPEVVSELDEQPPEERERQRRAWPTDLAGTGEAMGAGEIAGAGGFDAKSQRIASQRGPVALPLPGDTPEVDEAPNARRCPLELCWGPQPTHEPAADHGEIARDRPRAHCDPLGRGPRLQRDHRYRRTRRLRATREISPRRGGGGRGYALGSARATFWQP